MSDMAKLFTIIAITALPILIVLIWSFCGSSLDFMDLAQELDAESPLTEEERAGVRRAVEAYLTTTQFQKPTPDAHPSNDSQLVNEKDDEESCSTTSTLPTCSICLAEYIHDDYISRSVNLECEHLFHKDCILDWLITSAEQGAECPICRREFLNSTSEENVNVYPNERANRNSHNNIAEAACSHVPQRRSSFGRRSFSSAGGIGSV